MRTRNSRLLRLPVGGSLPIFGALVLGVGVLVFARQGTGARVLSPVTPDLLLPDVQVRDEADRATSLSEVARPSPGGSVLIAPAYARCRSSCPDLVRALDRGIRGLGANERPRVVFFLFDSTETADDVRAFRARHGVPASWSLLRAADDRATRAFFDAYSIGAMTSGEGYAHPSEILVLDDRLRWTGSLANAALGGNAIRDALERTRWPSWRATLSRPATWLAIASVGLFGSFAAIVVALRRMWRAGRTVSQPRGTHP